MHIGDVAIDFLPDMELEYEEAIEEYEEEVLVDGVPETPVDFFVDPVQNQGKPWCITSIFQRTCYYVMYALGYRRWLKHTCISIYTNLESY